jgi:hypothetical protein
VGQMMGQICFRGRCDSDCFEPIYVGLVDNDAAARVIALFEQRGQLDRLQDIDVDAARSCHD